MAWNEPGGNKDPWSRKPKGDSDLDKLILNEFSRNLLKIYLAAQVEAQAVK